VNWLGKLTGTGAASKSGWLDEFTAAPINVLLVQGDAGKGHIRLQEAQVRSAAFQAQANGNIGIEPILTNSTYNLPVNLALSRSLGERIGLSSADTNAVYVAMPQLLTVKRHRRQTEGRNQQTGVGNTSRQGGQWCRKTIRRHNGHASWRNH